MKNIALLAMMSLSIALNAQDKVLANEEQDRVFSSLQVDGSEVKDTLWTTGGTTGLNFSQIYLQNWAAGGQSSVSGTVFANIFAKYAKGNSTWDNTLDLAYGLLRQGDAGVLVKTDDKIDFASKYGRKASEHWYYSGLVNFRTQFAPGYAFLDGAPDETNIISDLLAPAYLLASIGMDYKPNEKFTAFLSPASYKMTIVMNDSLSSIGAFGVDPGTNVRSEVGGYVKLAYTTELVENVGLATKIDLFSNYGNNPQNIDINWEVLISMKINKFMSASVSTQLLYDDDIILQKKEEVVDVEGEITDSGRGPGVQFKEVLAIGFSYKF